MTIVPNWHPIFVHFSVGLLIVAAVLHVAYLLISKPELKAQCATVARWNLMIGAVFAVFTVIAGFIAYNSVDHDTPSHLAMTAHKNWALGTLFAVLVSAVWAFITYRKSAALTVGLTAMVLVSSVLLASTAWRGGELVYRYGLGVMSLPKADTHGHNDSDSPHSHGHDQGDHDVGHDDHHDDHGETSATTPQNNDTMAHHEDQGHEHSHEDGHEHGIDHSDTQDHADDHAHQDGHTHEDSPAHDDAHDH